MEFLKELIDPVATLAATFLGAFLAFRYESRRRMEELRNARIAAINRSLFVLYNLWNVLAQYEKEVSSQHRGSPIAWIRMPATSPLQIGEFSFDYAELSFLLESPDPDSYGNLLLEEKRFRHVVGVIERRSAMLVEDVLPKIAASGIKNGEIVDTVRMESLLGPHTTALLKNHATSIIEDTEASLSSIKTAFKRIRSVGKTMYSGEKFIDTPFDAKA